MRGGTGGCKEGQWSFFSETLQTCPNLFNFEEGCSSKVVLIPSWHIRKSDVLDRIECNSLGPSRGILRMPPMKLKHALLFKFCKFFRDVLVHGIVSMYVPSNNCTPGFDVIVSYSARIANLGYVVVGLLSFIGIFVKCVHITKDLVLQTLSYVARHEIK